MKRIFPGLVVAAGLATAGCQQQGSLVGVLATGEVGVTSIAVDDAFVYWTKLDGSIRKVPVDGGAVLTVASGQSGVDKLVADETHLVWSTGTTISALTKATGAIGTFAANGQVQGLSTDPTSVYWTVDSGDVNAALKDGSQLQALATQQVNPFAISAGAAMVYWGNKTNSGNGGAVLNVAPTSVVDTVAPMQDNPVTVATDGAHLYWGNQGDTTNGTVSIAALDGTSPVTLATGVSKLSALLGDGVTVYYASFDGTVSSVPVTGAPWMTVPGDGPGDSPTPGTTSVQTGTPLIIGPAGIVSLAADATNLYWANQSDTSGAILTMPKL